GRTRRGGRGPPWSGSSGTAWPARHPPRPPRRRRRWRRSHARRRAGAPPPAAPPASPPSWPHGASSHPPSARHSLLRVTLIRDRHHGPDEPSRRRGTKVLSAGSATVGD